MCANVPRSDIDLLMFGIFSYLLGGPSYELFHPAYVMV